MISHDLVGPRMAGPGMRYWELSRVLSRHLPVTLAAPEGSASPDEEERIPVRVYARGDADAVQALVETHEIIVAPGDTLLEFPFLLGCDRYMVMDGYDPHTLESLAWNQGQELEQRVRNQRERLHVVTMQCAVGDFFLCASQRQWMLWLGWLEATGRVNPLTYDSDPSLRALIDVVPTGIPARPPRLTAPLVRDRIPGIGADDAVLVWGGGIWNWLDPLTLIRAVGQVAARVPRVRLYFPGPRHPYQGFVPDMEMRERAVQVSDQLGLTGKHVFWGSWVPYQSRQNYLLEADVGCSLHFETLETCFAFRTRILDYVWAGLPMVVTRGDVASEFVREYRLGEVVDYQDVGGVTEALVKLLSVPRETYAQRFDKARRGRSWERSAAPLLAYCQAPRHAPDKDRAPDWQGIRHAAQQIAGLQQEVSRLQGVIEGYENGRFMRVMRWFANVRRRFGVGA